MDIEELRRRRKEVSSVSEKTLRNIEDIANESFRVAKVAHNSRNRPCPRRSRGCARRS